MELNRYLNASAGRLDQIEHILNRINSELTLIEFGPGSGDTLKQIRRKYQGAKLVGFDMYPTYVADDISIIKADLNHFDLTRYCELFSSANIILLLDVLEHLCSPFQLMSEVNNHINNATHIIISCPNFASIRMLGAWLKGVMPHTSVGFFDETHLQWLSPKDFSEFFYSKNFKSIEISYIYSKNYFIRLVQKIVPSRLCSQFMVYAVK